MINFEFLQRSGAPLPLLRLFSALLVAALLIVRIGASAVPTSDNGTLTVRFATFNASLNRFNAGDLVNDLSTPNNAQAQTVAEIIQRTRPDVLLINEFDFDADGLAARRFHLAEFIGKLASFQRLEQATDHCSFSYPRASHDGQQPLRVIIQEFDDFNFFDQRS